MRSRLLLCCLLAFNLSCNRNAPAGERRVGVLTFQNLTSDPSLDWMGRAIAGIVVAQTDGSKALRTLDALVEREAYLRRATATLEGYFTERKGRLRAIAYLRENGKNVRLLEADGAITDSPLKVADTLARQLAPDTRAFDTRNQGAVKSFYSASLASDLQGLLRGVEESIQADPGFGMAHVVRAEALFRLGRLEEGDAALKAAGSSRLSQVDRARLALLRANRNGTYEAKSAAIEKLAGLTEDPELWRNLANLSLQAKQVAKAATALGEATRLDPGEVQTYNLLGYTRAATGDLAAARQALETYRKMAPDDPNALDSLGEVHFIAGRFKEAARYFQDAAEKNPGLMGGGEWYRAALSLALAGDRAGAEKLFARYERARQNANDVLLPLRKAIWLSHTGRQKEAREAAARFTESNELGCAAAAQQVLWQLMDEGGADVARLKASAPGCTSNAARQLAQVAFLLALPSEPKGLSVDLHAWWLTLHKRWEDARSAWTGIYGLQLATAASESRVMLALTQRETGKNSEADELLKVWPVPPFGPDPGPGSLIFPQATRMKKAF